MRQRCKAHEITLIAFAKDASGVSLFDIVETSRHFASHFARKWVRSPEVYAISAIAPGQNISRAGMRVIDRTVQA